MWTIEDRDEVQKAIRELAAGKRAVKISFSGLNGANHSTEYAQADLPELRKLLHEIQFCLSDGYWEVENVVSRKF